MRGKRSFFSVWVAVMVIAVLTLTACGLVAEDTLDTTPMVPETPGVLPEEEEPGLVPGQTPEEPGVMPDETPGMTPEEPGMAPDETPGMTPEEEEPGVTPDQTPEEGATGGEANAVQVTLRDGEIVMDEELPAGPTMFEITNAGALVHNFRIDGQGITEELEEDLQPGETQTLEVDLLPGEYEVICPVNDHADQGMRLQLMVTEDSRSLQ